MGSSVAPRPQPEALAPVEWKGTARYEVVRTLGRGGMGAVYEARDRERGELVALKTLLRATPAALYMFKQEFRTLADVHHPNLVRLNEFVMGEGDHVFFTMELVRGVDFLSYVQHADARPGDIKKRSPADFDRLRPALCQLVEGVMALHAVRKLHRDIKPSNVLVTADGRVVLLDFGAATEVARIEDEELREEQLEVGTANYMAPEQAFEEPNPACDWYSVGTILYEAMCGRRPFIGSGMQVLTMKNTQDALAPSQHVDGVPADLEALCLALLHREPAMRPDGLQILSRLGATGGSALADSAQVLAAAPSGSDRVGLVGRESHLQALHAAFDATRAGRAVTLRVSGRAGMGKSSLVQRFLDDLVEEGSAVVLRGRAYEREAVPYKAVDSVIDALSRYLMRLNDDDLTLSLPKDTWALARLFPILRRVPRIGALAEESITDPQRVRRRAFGVLRELLSSLARRRPLVLFIDDVQWGDTDSAALLLELTRPPHAPAILLVMTYREEEAQASPFLCELRARWPQGAELRDLNIGPLEETDAHLLALALLGSSRDSAERIAVGLARESGGNPFLVEELVHSAGSKVHTADEDGSEAAPVTLDDIVQSRLAALPEDARRLLELVAVGGRPLRVSVATKASGMREEVTAESISLLRTRRFLRAGLRDGREVVEVIQDRIRETIVGHLSKSAVSEHHARIARALEATPDADIEALATHLLGAGEKARGAQFAERAAENAIEKLAFDQAAQLLRLALGSFPVASADGSRLRKRLGEVLDWAGRSEEAGNAYLEAAEGATALEKLNLQRAAAEQFYASGLMVEGTSVLHRVLAAVGLEAPRSPLSALFWLIFYRLMLRIGSLRFREVGSDKIRPEDRLRLDTLCAVALGFALVDFVLGTSMKARLLVNALRVGDRSLALRAASFVACDLGGEGGVQLRTERALWQLAGDLVEKENTPAAKFTLRTTQGVMLFQRGRFKEAKEKLDPLSAMLTNRRTGQQSSALFALYAVYLLGDMKDATQRYTRLVADADERGNRFMSVAVRTSLAGPVWLAADDPKRAYAELNDAMRQWTHVKASSQEWRAYVYGAEVDIYAGDTEAAYGRVQVIERARKAGYSNFVQYVRVTSLFVQGRCVIASLEGVPDATRRARMAEARRLTRRLERERMQWTAPLIAILKAGLAIAAGRRDDAADALRAASEGAEAADMALHAAAARYQRGRLLGGDAGTTLVQEAEDTMSGLGVAVPERYAGMLVPGRWRSGP
jgi:hypothetical protein